MNQISGKVLRAETRAGVPDIIVVLYDLDISFKNILENNGSRVTCTPFSPESPNDFSEQYLQMIYGSPEREEDGVLAPFSFSGDRLGSVITDQSGRFSLQYDDSAFQVNDQESRPDLVLLVIAPDYAQDVQSSKTAVVGTPEFHRILHVTAWPYRNIGRYEQIIIKLSDQALSNHGLTQPTGQVSVKEIGDAIADASAKRQELYKAMANETAIKAAINRHREKADQSSQATARISAVPKARRESELFITNRDQFASKELSAQKKGIVDISQHTEVNNIVPPFARLTIDEADLRYLDAKLPGSDLKIGLSELRQSMESDGKASIVLGRNNFCASLQEKNGGGVLESARNRIAGPTIQLDEPSVEDGGGTTEDGGGTTEDGGGTIEEPTPEMIIKNLVIDQVRSLANMQSDANCKDEVDQRARILKTIQTLKPPASPADVPAFHDFTHLQIAFPSVWEEAFDRDLSTLLKNLHIQYQERKDDLPGSVDEHELERLLDPDIELDLDEFIAIMQSIGAEISAVEEAQDIPIIIEEFYSNRYNESRAILHVGGIPAVATQIEAVVNTGARDELRDAWPQLSAEQRAELFEIAANAKPPSIGSDVDGDSRPSDRLFNMIVGDLSTSDGVINNEGLEQAIELYRELKREESLATEGEESFYTDDLLRAQQIIANPKGRVSRVQNLLTELAERMGQPHSFQVFAKNSVNFGLLSVYRQEWVPGDYQVGDLVSTIPMAPGEKRKYTKKEMRKRSRNQKEIEKAASSIKDERQITSRAISDITEKAGLQTNFQTTIEASASGSVIGLYNVSANSTTQFQRNQSAESQRVKKGFREAVRKAAQEYKNERSIELQTEESSEYESTYTGEISNPNNEIAVTYLFYELERQYRVTENLHRLHPVIMVAQEVPNPADIDNDWILSHEWILRRILLDASFHEALDYISEGIVADEINLATRRQAYQLQKELLAEVTANVDMLASSQSTLRDALLQTSERQHLAEKENAARTRGQKRRARRRDRKVKRRISESIANGTSGLTLGSDVNDPDALEARREALETRLGFLEGNLEDSKARLTQITVAYERSTEELIAAVESSFTKRNLVTQLRIHLKDNIIYYMQMIWSYEPTDQRYFRLYDIKVPIFEPTTLASGEFEVLFHSLSDKQKVAYLLGAAFGLLKPGDEIYGVQIPPPHSEPVDYRRLHEIADLDNPLGFKGNYMLFPLKECTYLTDYMMQDYIDNYFGIRDPDYAAQFSTEELLRRAEEIFHDESVSQTEKQAVKDIVQSRLTSPRLNDELIIVPTGQLFIEALKGEHALLENFKLDHRDLDVSKVNEEVREMQLENLRRAARLVSAEQDLSDPDIDKNVVVEGNANVTVSE